MCIYIYINRKVPCNLHPKASGKHNMLFRNLLPANLGHENRHENPHISNSQSSEWINKWNVPSTRGPQILPIKESTKSQKPVIPILDSIVYFPNKITQISPKLSNFFATVPFFQEILSHKNPWPHPKSCALQLVQILRHGVQAGSARGAIQALRGGSSWDGKTWKNLGFTNQITEKCHLKCSPKNQLKPPSCSSTSEKKPVLGWRATTSCRSRSASCWAARWSGTRSLANASPLSSGTQRVGGRQAQKPFSQTT